VSRKTIGVDIITALVVGKEDVRVFPSLFETDVFSEAPLPRLLPGTTIELNSGAATRYHKDFEQLQWLGKGAFGVVYCCRHRLDNRMYAIKQIDLSKTLEPVIRGKSKEVENALYDKIFKEIRTLARLNHCNVVRYYNSWLEALPYVNPKKQSKQSGDSFDSRESDSQSPLIYPMDQSPEDDVDLSTLTELMMHITLEDQQYEKDENTHESSDSNTSTKS